MHTQTVDIGTETIQLEWEGDYDYTNFNIRHNGNIIGSVPDSTYLEVGHRFRLPNQEEITVLISEQYGLEVWHNGVECISNTPSGTVDYYRKASRDLIASGMLLVLISFFFLAADNQGRTIVFLVFFIPGAVLVGLGFWGEIAGNKTAYQIAIGLCAISLIISLITVRISGIVVFGSLVYECYRAIHSAPPGKAKPKQSGSNDPLDQI